jgi:fructoselysine-6-P-deglycase FrlB-like protein
MADSLEELSVRPVSLVGSGSSYYAAQASAFYMSEIGGYIARSVPAGVYQPRPYESAVFISRTGTTTDVLEAAETARKAGVPRVAVTTDPTGPLARLADRVVPFAFVKEESTVQTGAVTCTLLFFRALADRKAGRPTPPALVDELRRALDDPIREADGITHVVLLGSGWRFGVACEAALKAQEMAQMWSERYIPGEYRHGPIVCADASTLVFVFDTQYPRIQELSRAVGETGARVVFARYDPLVELVRLQRLFLSIGLRRGLDVDHPRHTSRSVILDPPARQ